MELGAAELSIKTLVIDGGALIIEDSASISADHILIMNGGSIVCDFAYFSASYSCSREKPCVDLSLRVNTLVLNSGGSINCSALIINATSIDAGHNSSISSSYRGIGSIVTGYCGGSHGGTGGAGSPFLIINTSFYDTVDYPVLPGSGGLHARGGGVIQILSRYLRVGNVTSC